MPAQGIEALLGFNFCFLFTGASKTSSGFFTLFSIGLCLFLPARRFSTTLFNLWRTRFSFVRKYSDWFARREASGSFKTDSYYTAVSTSVTSDCRLDTTFKSGILVVDSSIFLCSTIV